MKIMSYNVRGFGGKLKSKLVKNTVKKEEVDILCVQESKLLSIDIQICSEVWGDREVDWRFVPAQNSSGGIITMWGKGDFIVRDMVVGDGALGIKEVWKNEEKETILVNVYSMCNFAGKRM